MGKDIFLTELYTDVTLDGFCFTSAKKFPVVANRANSHFPQHKTVVKVQNRERLFPARTSALCSSKQGQVSH